MAFVVPGAPHGKARARSTRSGHHYTPPETRAYEESVAWAIKRAMGACRPIVGPLRVELTAIYPIPASWSKKRQAEAAAWRLVPAVKPDLDNVAKAICDGGNGVAWVDDAQIVDLVVRKRYGLRPEVRVIAALLDADQTAPQQL